MDEDKKRTQISYSISEKFFPEHRPLRNPPEICRRKKSPCFFRSRMSHQAFLAIRSMPTTACFLLIFSQNLSKSAASSVVWSKTKTPPSSCVVTRQKFAKNKQKWGANGSQMRPLTWVYEIFQEISEENPVAPEQDQTLIFPSHRPAKEGSLRSSPLIYPGKHGKKMWLVCLLARSWGQHVLTRSKKALKDGPSSSWHKRSSLGAPACSELCPGEEGWPPRGHSHRMPFGQEGCTDAQVTVFFECPSAP